MIAALESYKIRDIKKVGTEGEKLTALLASIADELRKVGIQGLLGGFATVRYAGLNAFSAPFMMAATRGFAGAASDLLNIPFYYTKRLSSKPDDVAFSDVKGRPWTYREVDAAQQRHPLAASQTAAELDSSNIQFLMELMDNSPIRKIKSLTPYAARSYVGRFADYTDRLLRQGVFVSGLQRGLTEAQAAREAKDALFDYGRAREGAIDRGIGQMLYFWSFQSESLRAMTDAMWRDPKHIINMYRILRKEQEKNDVLATGGNTDQARVFRRKIKAFDRQESIVAGFAVPALESFGMVAEGMATALAPIMYEDVSLTESLLRQKDIVINRASFRPLLKIGLQWYNKKGFGSREGQFVPNPYVAGVPDRFWPEYRKIFNIVPALPDERRTGKASRFGEQWRFATVNDESFHMMMQQVLFVAGMQRRLEDVLKTSAIVTKPGQTIPYPYGEEHSLLEAIIYESGSVTFLTYRPPEQRLGLMRALGRREIETRR